jgi:hypothetical protein
MATNLVVNIASQFLGKKAFLDADKATKKLTGSVKSLGRVLGVSLSAAAVLAYGKASVKAASEDIKAQKLLANTLKNVGLAYAAVDAEGFISQMQSQTGVLDDQLRPAFAQLASVTGSVAKTEKLLGLAFDVSSGSGLDYASTIDILSQAYVGNTKGLRQLNLGLTQAEIKAMSFDDVIALLNERFAGSGKAALNTYAGQMSLLAAASSNASEVIGVSLLGAIDSLTGSDGIANVGTDIENAAKSLANFIDSVVYLKEQIASIPGAGIVKGAFGLVGNVLGRFSPQRAEELLKEIQGIKPIKTGYGQQSPGDRKAAVAADAAAVKRNKELAALAKSQAKSAADILKKKKETAALEKAMVGANLALGKGTDIFDMDKIQLNAALIGQAEALGKATTGSQILAIANDVQRLKVKQDINALEDAIAAKDTVAIEKATAKLNEDLKILGALQKQDAKLLDINKVLAGMKSTDLINLQNLQDALALLAQFTFPSLCGPTTTKPTTKMPEFLKSGITMIGKTPFVTGSVIDPLASLKTVEDTARATSVLPEYISATEFFTSLTDAQKADLGGYSPGMNTGAGYGAGGSIVVNVNAGAIGDENTIVDAVQNALNEIARRGYTTTYAGAISA